MQDSKFQIIFDNFDFKNFDFENFDFKNFDFKNFDFKNFDFKNFDFKNFDFFFVMECQAAQERHHFCLVNKSFLIIK